MENSIIQLYVLIIIIGIGTFITRAFFLYFIPKIFDHHIIKSGIKAIPSAMLVALVVPFTFFNGNNLVFWTAEVVAIISTAFLVFLFKKYGYGLVIALVNYFILKLII